LKRKRIKIAKGDTPNIWKILGFFNKLKSTQIFHETRANAESLNKICSNTCSIVTLA
jgi:hypothetical protein